MRTDDTQVEAALRLLSAVLEDVSEHLGGVCCIEVWHDPAVGGHYTLYASGEEHKIESAAKIAAQIRNRRKNENRDRV